MNRDLGRHAVIGHPVAHSLSPRIQRAFAAQTGDRIDYTVIDAEPADFAAFARGFFKTGGVGLNVTVPHKRAAFECAAEHADSAALAGVANVLRLTADGVIEAHNTDGSGFMRDLRERHGFEPRGARVLLLGAGGAARGVGFALCEAGVEHLTIVNRTPQRARALAARLGPPAQARPWPHAEDAPQYDLIVNATAAGLHGQSLALPGALLTGAPLCHDLAYGAAAQPFLDWARAAGAPAVDGLGMLVETAADSFAIWHGRRPQTEPVLRALAR
ncbi:MAG TPA: shikimate dehydrogenase [Rhodanobacteraceae bacterium]|nr:shikimate dehydrogenase [Rhodanobacteraceae bacterium]